MIIVSGEALMDVFDAGATPRGQALDARIGGSPLNVAIGLSRLSQPAVYFGAVGQGFLGDRLMAALAAEGVGLGPVKRVAAPTTLGLVGLDARGVADYAFYGDGAADRQLEAADLARVPEDAMAYHFGSYALVVQPVGATLHALAERQKSRSVVACDVNVRLNVQPALEVWRESVAAIAARATILKLSDEDLGLLYPGADAAALAARWLAAGTQLVVMTRGSQGALAWGPGGEISVAPQPSRLIDTVGAGDSFQAAMLAALAERGWLTRQRIAALTPAELAPVLDFAARAAAITCSRRGADLPRRVDLG